MNIQDVNTYIIDIAGITVLIQSVSDFSRLFSPFAPVSPCGHTDISVCVSAEEIETRSVSYPGLNFISVELCLIYEKICNELPRFDAFMLHAATLEYGGKAYAFCAVSGTGKSTHTRLWIDLLGDRCRYINGDMPIIRILNGVPSAFGTPWNGKERQGGNISAPLAGIGFIVRDNIPSVRRVDKREGLFRVLSASHQPKEHSLDDNFYQCVGQVVGNVPMYELKCDISAEAAKLSFEAMTGEKL